MPGSLPHQRTAPDTASRVEPVPGCNVPGQSPGPLVLDAATLVGHDGVRVLVDNRIRGIQETPLKRHVCSGLDGSAGVSLSSKNLKKPMSSKMAHVL